MKVWIIHVKISNSARWPGPCGVIPPPERVWPGPLWGGETPMRAVLIGPEPPSTRSLELSPAIIHDHHNPSLRINKDAQECFPDSTSFMIININIWSCENKRSEAGTDWPSASFIIHQTGSLRHAALYSPRVHGWPAFIGGASDFRCQWISPPGAAPGNTQIYWSIWVSCRDCEMPNLSTMLCKKGLSSRSCFCIFYH